ncbi:MAG TPA: formylglycine-generating enzyme family protein [Myxococcota bacterium]|nr:formylglycine-generating enzyme family protein [Myxococcota bacterium]
MRVLRYLAVLSLIFAVISMIGCDDSAHRAHVLGGVPLPTDDEPDIVSKPDEGGDTDEGFDVDPLCVPECGDRVCGPDPVCGKSCGTCDASTTCNSQGQCECVRDCTGRVCGLDPVCGEPCGACDENWVCVLSGKCIAPTADCSNGWCLIPSGIFKMGSLEDDPYRELDEGPVHLVTISRSFYMAQTEVTQGQWKSLIGNNPSEHSACGDNCPVENVNWYEAVHYANALSEREGFETCYTLSGCSGTVGSGESKNNLYQCAVTFKGLGCAGYRLPTEAEWEYAARAGTSGPRYGEIDATTWYWNNSSNTSHPVGGKAANSWGLYDVLGNVFEWVYDWYSEDYYSTCSSNCTDPTGPATGFNRVNRSGGWGSDESRTRVVFRNNYSPDERRVYLGFRLVRSAP